MPCDPELPAEGLLTLHRRWQEESLPDRQGMKAWSRLLATGEAGAVESIYSHV